MAANNPGEEPPILVQIDIRENLSKPDDFLVVIQTSREDTAFHIPRRMLAEIGQRFLAADEHYKPKRPN